MNATRSIVDVGISMVLRDNFTQPASRISDSFKGLMRDMSDWNQALTSSHQGILEASTRMLTGFGQAYSHMAGVYDQIFLTSKMSGATLSQQKELLQLTKDINAITPLTNTDIASGMKYLAMAGNTTEQIQDMIGPAAELASIFSMPLGEKGGVADLMTNIMQTFNIPSQNAREVVDQLSAAVTSANMSLQDLAQSFMYSGAEFRNAKISMGDAAAAIGVLGNQGIQASSAGTALANMMRYLTLSVTGQRQQGANALKSLGIDPSSLVDAQGNLLRLDKIISMIGEKLKGRRGVDTSAAMFNLVGVRGTRALSALLQDYWSGANKLTSLMEEVRNSGGTVAGMTQERLQTPQGLLDQLRSNWENFVTTTGESIAAMMNPLLKAGSMIMRIITKIQETWAGSFLTKVVATGAAVATIVTGFRLISSTIRAASLLQTIATNQTQGMAAATATVGSEFLAINQQLSLVTKQFVVMEAHIIRMVNYMRELVRLQMAASMGLGINKRGRWYNKKTGKLAKAPDVGPEAVPLMGALLGGAGGSAGQAAQGAAGQAAANAAGQAAQGAARRGLIRGGLGTLLGRFMGVLGGPWGMAITIGLPLLIQVISSLTSSVDKNTEAQNNKEDPNTIRAKNEEAFIQAVRIAIRDGMKDSNINITIDGESVGSYTPGTTQDYIGRALGIE